MNILRNGFPEIMNTSRIMVLALELSVSAFLLKDKEDGQKGQQAILYTPGVRELGIYALSLIESNNKGCCSLNFYATCHDRH